MCRIRGEGDPIPSSAHSSIATLSCEGIAVWSVLYTPSHLAEQFGIMAPVLWVLAVLSTITVIHRVQYTYQNTKHLAPLSQ